MTSSRLLGSLSNSHATVGVGGAQTHEPKFSQSRRHSSSGGGHGGHGSAGFGSSGIIYTLLGASLTGGAIAVYIILITSPHFSMSLNQKFKHFPYMSMTFASLQIQIGKYLFFLIMIQIYLILK